MDPHNKLKLPKNLKPENMKKMMFALGVLGLFACNDIGKLDKQLYDSTEEHVPVTKLDQLDALDKQDAAGDTSAIKKDTVPHH